MRVARWIGGGLVLAGLVAAVGYGGRRGCEAGPGEPAPDARPGVPVERAAGWVRAVAAEPDPAARGLYRRAIDLAHAGDAAGSAAAVEQLRAQYGETRFGARVARDGDPRAAVALLASAAAVLVTVLARDDAPHAGARPARPAPALRLPPPGKPSSAP